MKTVNTMIERYFWVALYNDGTQLLQFEPQGGKYILHSFYEIDQDKLKQFVIIDAYDNTKRYALNFKPDMKLIWYWQRVTDIDINLRTSKRRATITCFGWEKNIAGHTYKTIVKIFPNGQILVGDE